MQDKITPDKTAGKDRQALLVGSLVELLEKGSAHLTLEAAVKGIPKAYYGVVPEGLPYSLWQVVEHIRLTQKDILEFSRDADYTSPPWPGGYWPKHPEPPGPAAWEESLEEIRKDRRAFVGLLRQPGADLFKPFPHGDGQHLLREAMLIADHTAYHTGQILVIRRILGIYQ